MQITSLPFTITAPGHYKLTAQAVANYHPVMNIPAILINDPGVTSETVLDLDNVVLDYQNGIPGQILASAVIVVKQGVNNVTIKNGTITNVFGACILGGQFSPDFNTLPVHSLTIKSINFSKYAPGIVLAHVFDCVIKDCVFTEDSLAIADTFSPGDEQFLGNTFIHLGNNPSNPINVSQPTSQRVIDYQTWRSRRSRHRVRTLERLGFAAARFLMMTKTNQFCGTWGAQRPRHQLILMACIRSCGKCQDVTKRNVA